MGLIAVVRSQGPVIAAPVQPAPEPAARVPVVEAARPVAETQRKDAPQQSAAAAALVAGRLAERDESDHPAAEARVAAEAAREAYIKASIAAGVSPLPLP
jgi:hypothetical protein